MRTCIVDLETFKVVNVIERGIGGLPATLKESAAPPKGCLFIEHDTAGPGWLYASGELSPPLPSTADAEAIRHLDLAQKRAAALHALDEKRLQEAASNLDAPQEVKDYFAARGATAAPTKA